MNASFNCDRTCPMHKTHWCRFNALFSKIGVARVHSHTVKIAVPYKDPRTLERACKTLGWKWLGYGKHSLSENSVTGHGFMPETFLLPAVLDAEGELHFDTYEGSWGDQTKLDLLKSEYAIATAEQAAEELGWQTERTAEGLTVHHPAGGILTVSKEGVCETTGFIGSGCHEARESLHLAADGAAQNKPEYMQVAAQVQAGS
jgi:hypothetical protein